MNNINKNISKEEVDALPTVLFDGSIFVIDSPSDVAEAVSVLRKDSVLGFDTETRPSFKKGVLNKIALMQLSTASTCFLFRLNKIGASKELFNLLSDKSIVKVGLSLDNDFLALRRSFSFTPNSFEDIQSYAKNYGIEEMSLQKIYALLFGKKISKGQRLSNWEAPMLTNAQQKYAAIDAWTCREIYFKLKSLNTLS